MRLALWTSSALAILESLDAAFMNLWPSSCSTMSKSLGMSSSSSSRVFRYAVQAMRTASPPRRERSVISGRTERSRADASRRMVSAATFSSREPTYLSTKGRKRPS
ncbi:MAG: hypothetical protein IKP53_02780 [Candidatus Methanomethylophilaceae archaeon]|nr:hypothetical protein [Candidatus Methanomethylophilaceae archaeon]